VLFGLPAPRLLRVSCGVMSLRASAESLDPQCWLLCRWSARSVTAPGHALVLKPRLLCLLCLQGQIRDYYLRQREQEKSFKAQHEQLRLLTEKHRFVCAVVLVFDVPALWCTCSVMAL
jgi:hypothetical protein